MSTNTPTTTDALRSLDEDLSEHDLMVAELLKKPINNSPVKEMTRRLKYERWVERTKQ